MEQNLITSEELADYFLSTYTPHNGFNYNNPAMVELAKTNLTQVIEEFVVRKINAYAYRDTLLRRVSERTKQKEAEQVAGVVNASTNTPVVSTPDGNTIDKVQVAPRRV